MAVFVGAFLAFFAYIGFKVCFIWIKQIKVIRNYCVCPLLLENPTLGNCHARNKN